MQQTEYDVTNIEINLDGLSGKMSGYHVHMVTKTLHSNISFLLFVAIVYTFQTSVEHDLEFPCESTSLYGHWNPWNVNVSGTPPSGEGTTDQYEMGDISGKFGTLENKKRCTSTFNDTMLPLFGLKSILGRSIVIHKREKNLR